MYNTAMRILRNQDDARDVLQESFIDMYRKLNSFRGDASFGAWFRRIVVNKSLNFLKRNRQPFTDIEDIPDQAEEEKEEAFEFEIGDVKNAMEKLPVGYKLVFDLYMFEDFSHREIAGELGISEATSKSQLSRAKLKLRNLLMASKS